MNRNLPALRVSPKDGRYLETEDGTPFIPIGLNLCFPRFVEDEGEILGKMKKWMGSLAAHGGNFFRLWLSHPAFDVECVQSGVYEEGKARRIDAVFAMAAEAGLYVNVCLEHFRSLDTPPPAFPGAASFGKPLHHRKNGGAAETMTEFWRGAESRSRFKKKIAWMAARWGALKHVAVWELWNEVNAVEGEGYEAWTVEMLAELKRCFPQRITMQSLGGWETLREKDTYARFLPMAHNDLSVVHRYLNEGGDREVAGGPIDVLAAGAVRDARSLGTTRPILHGEGGAVEPHHAARFRHYEADRDGAILHDVLFAPFFAGAAGSGQIWHWDFYVDSLSLWPHFARFAEAIKGVDPLEERFEPRFVETATLRIHGLLGKKTALLWLRDPANDWRTEFEKKIAPAVLAGVEIDLAALGLSGGAKAAECYDPWKHVWTASDKVPEKNLRLPSFQRSLVVRIAR
ncbi:MAG: cellulase family glycosylhydrolase [Spirochaetes bacterium]|nr:cellulase family glycosylhydrolase [Spirochaetota bacterium]